MERMRAGQSLTLCGSDAAAGAKEWRDAAEQYQSAIEQKKLCVYCYAKLLKRFLLMIARSVQSHSGVSVTGAADFAVPVDNLRARVKTVRITLNAIQGDVVVPVDDLRPRFKTVKIIVDVIEDIRFCEKLVDKWMTELDKCVASRFSRHRVPSNDNNGFTESRAIPINQTIESES